MSKRQTDAQAVGTGVRRSAQEEAEGLRKFLNFHSYDEEDYDRWSKATYREKGRALAELLAFVDAVGRFPPKPDLVEAFPPPHELRRRCGPR